MDKILNGNYTIGDATWDTGVCETCGKKLTKEEREQAAKNMLITGMMYWCRQCSDDFFKKNERMFK
jgi:DNA-directed RNA polymerase subunit RPC12/RpoP